MMAIERFKVPTSVKNNAAEFALFTFVIGKNTYFNKSADDALKLLKPYVSNIQLRLSAAIAWHTELINIREESLGLVAVSDFVAGAKMPPLSIWEPIKGQLATLQSLQSAKDVPALLVLLRYTTARYEEAYQLFEEYKDKNQKGYDSAIESLTFVRQGAETVIGAYNPYVGGAYTAGLKLITQAQELRYNMRDEIDWKGIAIELIIDELFSLAADRIADKFIAHLRLPGVQQSLPFTLKDRVSNLMRMGPNAIKKTIVKGLVNKAAKTITESLKKGITQYRDSPKGVTWDMLTNTAAEQYGRTEMSKSAIEEILSAAMAK
jgi:hypothetical protein